MKIDPSERWSYDDIASEEPKLKAHFSDYVMPNKKD